MQSGPTIEPARLADQQQKSDDQQHHLDAGTDGFFVEVLSEFGGHGINLLISSASCQA